MRIMFMANAPWCTTGYGVQGKHLVPRLKAAGHDLAYFAFYGLQNGVISVGDVPIYPMGTSPWGEDILEAHMAHFRADMLITLMDVWVTDFFGRKAKQHNWIWCPWTPVDQEPVPPLVLSRLEGAHTVLPYALHGEREFRKAGIQNVRYVPHGVHCGTFAPGDRAEARRKLKLPEDAFVIGMVAANKGYPSRKCFPEQLLAFSRFKANHPEALLYLHTLKSQAHGGLNFAELLWRLELQEGRDVVFTDQYSYTLGLPEPQMADLYRAFDFLSLTSSGEGFGIPLIEAQACGIPVVSSANTAQTELTFAGISITKQHPWWTPLASWAMIPDVDAIVDAYEAMYGALQHDDTRAEMAEKARAGALVYDWDNVVGHWWLPFLRELEAERSHAAGNVTSS